MYERGMFGNRLRTWPSIEAFLQSGFTGTVTMRHSGNDLGKFIAYEVPADQVLPKAQEWQSLYNLNIDEIKINESAPDYDLLWQGEIMRSTSFYCLTYSTEKTKMKTALLNAKHMEGIGVLYLLKNTLTASSYDDVQELFDLYPDSIIELSVYGHCLGDRIGRNAIIWEIRNY